MHILLYAYSIFYALYSNILKIIVYAGRIISSHTFFFVLKIFVFINFKNFYTN